MNVWSKTFSPSRHGIYLDGDLFLSLSLFHCISVSLYVCLPLSMSVSFSFVSVSFSLSLSEPMSLFLCICTFYVSASASLFLCMSVSLPHTHTHSQFSSYPVHHFLLRFEGFISALNTYNGPFSANVSSNILAKETFRLSNVRKHVIVITYCVFKFSSNSPLTVTFLFFSITSPYCQLSLILSVSILFTS